MGELLRCDPADFVAGDVALEVVTACGLVPQAGRHFDVLSRADGVDPDTKRGFTMAISDDDLQALFRALEREQQSWIEGRFTTDVGFEQAEDMTIFGPFGGESPRLTATELAPLQQRAASQFAGGTGTCDVVKTIVSDDLAVVVMVERNEVRLRDRDQAQAWVLRTTSVFRLDGERGWLRLHRHADPLIRFRPSDETFSIAAG